jgi:hypothetical protein
LIEEEPLFKTKTGNEDMKYDPLSYLLWPNSSAG